MLWFILCLVMLIDIMGFGRCVFGLLLLYVIMCDDSYVVFVFVVLLLVLNIMCV